MESYGMQKGYHQPLEYTQMGKRTGLPLAGDSGYDQILSGSMHPRVAASSSTRLRETTNELYLPASIRNLEPSLKDKGMLVWKLVTRAANRIRRPGGQRAPGSFGEYFCECGKDYMNSCGLNNHWKLSHKLPGRPPQLFVPSAVQMKFLHGMELTAQDLNTVLVQPSVGTQGLHPPNAIRFEPGQPQETYSPQWTQPGTAHMNMDWMDPTASGRRGYFGDSYGAGALGQELMMQMPGMASAPQHLRHSQFSMEMQPVTNSSPTGHFMTPALSQIPNLDQEYNEWIEHAKEYQSCINSWVSETGKAGASKDASDGESERENRKKLEIWSSVATVVLEEEIVRTLQDCVLESEQMMVPIRPESSLWERLFFQTKGRQIGATHCAGLFLLSLRPHVSLLLYTETAVLLGALLCCIGRLSQPPVLDSPFALLETLEPFGRDFWPQFLLSPGLVSNPATLKLLGLTPTAHRRVFSTLRLLSMFVSQVLEVTGGMTLHWNR